MFSQTSTLSTSPFLPMLAQLSQLLVLYVFSFTPPSSSIRYLGILVNVLLAYICQIHIPNLNNGYWAANFGAMSFLSIAMTFERLIVGKWSWEVGGPEAWRGRLAEERKRSAAKLDDEKHKDKTLPPTKKMMIPPEKTYLNYGVELIFNYRGVNRPWEVSSLPPAYTSPNDTLSTFLLSRSFAFLACFSLTLYAAYQPSPPSHLITPSHVHTLSRLPASLTIEEISFKFLSMLGFLFGIYTTITWYTAFYALFFAGSGLSDFRSWRRNYNSPAEAYTIRRFWSPFWHQYLRNSLQGNADWIVDNWVPRFLLMGGNRVVKRYMRLMLAFTISGIIHIGGDVGTGIPLRESGALKFFVMQGLGVMGEDAVIEFWKRRGIIGFQSSSSSSETTSGKIDTDAANEKAGKGKENGPKHYHVEDHHGRKKEGAKPPALWIRCLGYLWVLTFMTVTVPAWSFPYLRRHVPGAAPAFKLKWLGL